MTRSRLARRRVLTAALGTGVLALGGPALAACTTGASAPPGPDPLEPVAARAEEDAVLADAVAAAHPDLAPWATALAADRRQHATALRAELRRVRPTPPNTTSPTAAAPVDVRADDLGAARTSLVDAVHSAQEQAAAPIGGAPGHRAALLASIVACCASHEAVLP